MKKTAFNKIHKKMGAKLVEFAGFEMLEKTYKINSFICNKCEEACSVIRLYRDGKTVSFWNDRCGIYSTGEATISSSE